MDPRSAAKPVTMPNSSLEDGAMLSVFCGRKVITNRERGYCVTSLWKSGLGMKCYVFKDVQVRVYTGGVRSASGFIFFYYGQESMPIEHWKDTGLKDTSLPEKPGEGGPVEGM